MTRFLAWCATWLAAVSWLVIPTELPTAYAQQPAPAPASASAAAPAPSTAETAAAPQALTEDELETLVARIALYPDDLVALITASSLFPLQIVEANRFLETKKTDDKLKPKETWDGSIISLLNYPEVVKMMNDDLEWTQTLGQAITYQQKDVLVAIQQLRDQAVAKGAIKTDDKITIVNEGDNVVIRPTDPEKVYIPKYPPEMLYEPGYAYQPISYYDQPYSNYWYPGAAFFAAAVTGVAWAAAVNWDNWGVWGGNWGGDIDVDCNNCFNNRNFNGKVKWNDVDWKNVDRSKLNIDRSQLANVDRNTIRNNLQANGANNLRNRASEINRERGAGVANRADRAADVRRSTAEGLKNRGGAAGQAGLNRPGGGVANRPAAGNRPGAGAGVNRPGGGNRPAAGQRPANGKLAGKADNRGRANALGNVSSKRGQVDASRRGAQSRANVQRPNRSNAQRSPNRSNIQRGGGGGRQYRGGGGGRPQMSRGGGGGRQMPRGGGGRGGGRGRR